MGTPTMGCCGSADEKESEKNFKAMDADGNSTVSKQEFTTFVGKNDLLLQPITTVTLNLGYTEEDATEACVRAAMKLACGDRSEMTQEEFHKFRTMYCDKDTAEGAKRNQGLIHHCIFAAYDKDNNGYLDVDELDKYLDVYFDGTFVKEGDPRLKNLDKEGLKKHVMENMDKDKDKKLTFDEIHVLISGDLASALSSVESKEHSS